VREAADLTGFSRQTVSRMFENEKGVLHDGCCLQAQSRAGILQELPRTPILNKTSLLALLLILSLPYAAQQPQPSTPPQPAPLPAHSTTGPTTGKRYTNVDGNLAHTPMRAPSAPSGASAKCSDGTYSFSQHRSGTCSHHGGVGLWLTH
jgi:hypothetical protein